MRPYTEKNVLFAVAQHAHSRTAIECVEMLVSMQNLRLKTTAIGQ
jgi:hypothetical protein